MANLNKVMLIGRLTRDPEVRVFSTGGKVAHFGFAVNNRKKNPQTGVWEEEAVFLDVDAFNRGDFGKLADTVEQYLRKGKQIYLEGHLKLDQWTDKDGQKRSKIKIVADNVQFLDSQGAGEGGAVRQPRQDSQRYSAPPDDYSSPPMEDQQPAFAEPAPGRSEEDIPF